jgi:uncharacterized repeat protein (TIGR03847 family)
MIDYGFVDAVDAQAIGEPGQRTFRVRVVAGANRASLWLEKEQLAMLGRAISQLLAERSSERGRPVGTLPEVEDFDSAAVDMRVARLGLDFEPERQHVVVLVDDRAALERGDTPAFRMEINRAMALSLVESIPAIVAAGRPVCPLCGQPLEDGVEHFCPRTNGHSQEMEIPGDRLEEEED